MKRSIRWSSLGVAAVLALSGLVFAAGNAHAAEPKLVANYGSSYKRVTGTLEGGECATDVVITATKKDSTSVLGTTKLKGEAGKVPFEFAISEPGSVVLEAVCQEYGGTVWTAEATAVVEAVLDFDPVTWESGQKVKITGEGFKPGEKVILRAGFFNGDDLSEAAEKAVTGWGPFTAVADANGVVTFNQALPFHKDLQGRGDLYVSMMGETSGVYADVSFSWYKDDKPSDGTKKPGVPSSGV